MQRPALFPSHLCVVVACCSLFWLAPGDASAKPTPKNPYGAAPQPTYKPKPKMVCASGYFKCDDAYGNCCAVGSTCTPDGMCSVPEGGGGGKGGKTKASKMYDNDGVFQVAGSGGGGGTGATGTAYKPKPKVPSNAIVAQWPGFRMTEDGGSEVVIEFSKAAAAPTEHKAAGSVTYVFKGAHLLKSNNQNPLITVHFNTPVASARLIPKGGELHLVIDYRAGANATAVSGLRPSVGTGQQFFVKFPSGAWLPQGSDLEDAPAATQKLTSKGKPAVLPATPAPNTAGGSKTGPNP